MRCEAIALYERAGISQNRTPPLPLAVFGVSTSDTVTASGGAPRFLTTASVMSLTSEAFQEIDHNFRHCFLRVSNPHLTDTKCALLSLRACLKCVFRLSEIGGVAQGSWIE